MKQYGKKRIFFGCLAAAMAVGLLAGGLWWSGRAEPTFARLTQQTLIIDPGHGERTAARSPPRARPRARSTWPLPGPWTS